ncbi:phage tail protein I [Pseudoalteromonas luteoviolacea]|uniref:phage tail protein I n=1 Tax=Pseudoalteromonas luteoviolacea TaxID=43657 RepID=UPI001B38772F|nr:phage tail protein I [Pseudoalteromonas luteoviolacea]MBQ4836306.1 phage tail protein I [Pseudoalteromonas luteoviolacea]
MSNFTLQGNTTELELALEHCCDRVLQIPVKIDHLWDPWKCPATFLPWLADALSVDVWDSGWPEHVQRKVIADSVPRHRYKGTSSAVNNALKVLSAKVELQEWWQYGGVPHSAKLLAIASENLDSNGNTFLSPKLQGQMWQSVVATKPMRTQIDFTIGVNLKNDMHVFGGAQSPSLQVALHRDDPIFNFSTVALNTMASAHSSNMQTITLGDDPSLDFELASIQMFSASVSSQLGAGRFQDNPKASFATFSTVSSAANTANLACSQMRDAPKFRYASSNSVSSGAHTVSIQNITLNF